MNNIQDILHIESNKKETNIVSTHVITHRGNKSQLILEDFFDFIEILKKDCLLGQSLQGIC